MTSNGSARQLYAEYFRHDQPRCIILLHALGLDGRMWEEVLSLLPDSHAALAFDLRGHGRSSQHRAEEGVRLQDLAEDVHASAALLGRDSATIVGVGLGAGVALALRQAHPDFCEGLVLVNPPLPVGEQSASAYSEVAEAFQRAEAAERSGKLLERWLEPEAALPEERLEVLHDVIGRNRAADVAAVAGAVARADASMVAGGDGQVAVLVGDADDLTPTDVSDAVERLGAEVRTVADARHLLPVDHPELVVGTVQAQL